MKEHLAMGAIGAGLLSIFFHFALKEPDEREDLSETHLTCVYLGDVVNRINSDLGPAPRDQNVIDRAYMSIKEYEDDPIYKLYLLDLFDSVFKGGPLPETQKIIVDCKSTMIMG